MGAHREKAGRPKLFAGVIFYAACKRSSKRSGFVHADHLAPIHGAENMSAFATAVFSLAGQERGDPFQSHALFNFEYG